MTHPLCGSGTWNSGACSVGTRTRVSSDVVVKRWAVGARSTTYSGRMIAYMDRIGRFSSHIDAASKVANALYHHSARDTFSMEAALDYRARGSRCGQRRCDVLAKGFEMTILKFCGVVVAALAVAGSPGCGGSDVADGAEPVSQVDQDITMCEVDCPSGPVLTCTTTPCSVTATSLTCNGTTTNCPCGTCATSGADCGSISDGCGHTLNCGTCGSGQQCVANSCEITCSAGQTDCCGDGICRSALACFKFGC